MSSRNITISCQTIWPISISWLAGIVLAHGFWNTLLAVLLPPYAWYLLTEKLLHMVGMV